MTFYHKGSFGGPHVGINKVIPLMEVKYWWREWKKDTIAFVRACDTCQVTKGNRDNKRGLHQKFTALAVNEFNHIDFVGPINPTNEGYTWIMTTMCRFSKYCIFVPLKQATATEAVLAYVKNWISVYGSPQRLLSDRGSQFISHVWQNFVDIFGIQPLLTTEYHPQTNGAQEIVHRYLKSGLRTIFMDRGLNITNNIAWDKFLPSIQASYNGTKHSAIGMQPNELMMGRKLDLIVTTLPNLLMAPSNAKPDMLTYYAALKTHVKNLRTIAIHNQAQYDKKRFKRENASRYEHSFSVGDYVKRAVMHKKKGNPHSFGRRWISPFKITKTLRKNRVLVQDVFSAKQFRTNVSDLQPYYLSLIHI